MSSDTRPADIRPRPFPLLDRKPPVAEIRPSSRVVHGAKLTDNYAWLRAKNWQRVIAEPESVPADIGSYLRKENAYASAAMKPLAGLQKVLIAEMRARIREDESEPPLKDGEWLYYERYRKRQQYAVFCRRNINSKREEVLLDGPREAREFDYFELGSAQPSPDHARLAWAADTNGSESYTLRLRDLATGEDHDRITRTSGEVVWGRSSAFFYYVELDASQRPWRVMRHRIGETQKQDVEIYRETDSGWFVGLDITQDDRYGFISIHDHETSEILLLDLDDAGEVPVPVFPRTIGVEYEIDHHEGRLIVRTNHGGAEDFKIIALPVGETDLAKGEVLVPETPGRMVQSVNVLKNWLIWSALGETGPAIHIREWATGKEQVFEPRAAIGEIGASIGLEFDSDTLRFSYSSPNEPDVMLDRNLRTGEEVVLKVQEVPSGHDPERYVVERLFAPSHDGAMVPVTVLRLKDTPVDGTAPVFLYGYGSYGYAMDADFETDRLSLVERGFIYAIAHVRGGLEKGYAWYRDGKREKKINTFLDFLAVADFLVAERYAAPGRIVANGVSAGGMLMGAIANMAGEKFAGIIAEVPFVDSLNTILDPTLPLTPPEWVEWGNPIEDKAVFETMRAYSPYDNIAAKPYPPMLVIGGLTDPRVTYWEPAKFVAKLRATMTGGGPVLLHTNMGAGHGGASGRFEQLDDVARVYAFALEVVGLAGAETDEADEAGT
jgi:oligopeptidase B